MELVPNHRNSHTAILQRKKTLMQTASIKKFTSLVSLYMHALDEYLQHTCKRMTIFWSPDELKVFHNLILSCLYSCLEEETTDTCCI